jgi:hypothetical protein
MQLGYSTATLAGSGVALIIALIGAIMVAIFFFNPKHKARYTGWLQKVNAHVNFDRFLLTSILKFLYAFGVIYAVVYGFVLLFSGSVFAGLMTLALAPVALRVGFEQLLLLLSIRKETAETNDLLRRIQGLPPRGSVKPQAPVPPRPAQPADTRYGGQSAGYGGQGFAGYPRQQQSQPSQQTQQPQQRADSGMTQRYAPARPGDYSAPSGQTEPASYRRPSAGRTAPADSAPRAANPAALPSQKPGAQ